MLWRVEFVEHALDGFLLPAGATAKAAFAMVPKIGDEDGWMKEEFGEIQPHDSRSEGRLNANGPLLNLGLALDVQLRFAGVRVHAQHLPLVRLISAADGYDAHHRTEEATQDHADGKADDRRFSHRDSKKRDRHCCNPRRARKLRMERCRPTLVPE